MKHTAPRHPELRGTCLYVCTVILLSLLAIPSRADRIILAPRGSILTPGLIRGEFAIHESGRPDNIEWVNFGIPGDDLGLELEVERDDLFNQTRETFSLQYLMISEGLTNNIAPSLSLGARDLLNRGREGLAFFVAATKTIGLSRKQEQIVRDVKLHAGVGTHRLEGPFIGGEIRLTAGFRIIAEYAARKVNAELAIPVGKRINLRAYTLDGSGYFGASMGWRL